MLRKLLLVVITALALLTGTAAAEAAGTRADLIPPSLDGQNCPTGRFQRTSGPFTFEYRFLYRYTPNGGLVWIGRYHIQVTSPNTPWRDLNPPEREFTC
ncbi:hypothetical protein [Amycolatopsis magusensis]|uniref:hypothetical protein n=1 Tax=Amycolatopsis magusensis TaxID=882444 RepID=UPI00379700F2